MVFTYILFMIVLCLIPSFCVAAWASVLFFLIGKIRQKWLRCLLPVAVAGLFIAGNLPFQAFLYTILGENEVVMSGPYPGILLMIPSATILAMGVITPFLLIREQFAVKKPWHVIFAAATVAATYTALYNFIVFFGQNRALTQTVISAPYLQYVTLSSQFLVAMAVAAAVFGVLLFLQDAGRGISGNYRKWGIRVAIAGSLFLILPAAGTAGLAVFLWWALEKIHGMLLQAGIAVAALLGIALFGTALAGIPGMGTVVNFSIITLVVIAFAVLVPFLYLSGGIDKNRQTVILFAGAVAADIVLSLIAWVFELGNRLTSDPITIVTFAEGGMIFAACAYVAGHYLGTRQTLSLSRTKGGEVS